MDIPNNEDLLKNVKKICMDVKNFIDRAISDIGSTAARNHIIFGTATGWLTGLLSAKVGTSAAASFGGSVILSHIANQTGYISVNWDKIYEQCDIITDKIECETTGKRPNISKMVERHVDRKLAKAEEIVRKQTMGLKTWYWNFSKDNQYHATESHVFLVSFIAGIALGIICC